MRADKEDEEVSEGVDGDAEGVDTVCLNEKGFER